MVTIEWSKIRTALVIFMVTQALLLAGGLVGFIYTTRVEQQYQNDQLTELKLAQETYATKEYVDEKLVEVNKNTGDKYDVLNTTIEGLRQDLQELRSLHMVKKESAMGENLGIMGTNSPTGGAQN